LVAASGVAFAGGDAAAGKTKAASCGGCHGANGISAAPDVNPSLAGMDETAQIQAMMEYKDGTRDHATMKVLVMPLSDQDMADIAAFYASQPAE
jgi:cytochrome c553